MKVHVFKSQFFFSLNAIREMCQRAPLIMTEDLLRDLVEYKRHRVRSVSMAAQSLIHVYRISVPSLLRKRDKVLNFVPNFLSVVKN